MLKQYYRIGEELKSFIQENKDKQPFVIGIDGNCGSGKTTLARQLSEVLCCDVVHMDDFFLPEELRTQARLNEIAGNFHYERFKEEVIGGIKSRNFTYRVYSCKRLAYTAVKKVSLNQVLIIEGSYSFSHNFWEIYDYKIYMECSCDTQLQRIQERGGAQLMKQFIDKWIPMENKYFAEDRVKDKADLVINTDEK